MTDKEFDDWCDYHFGAFPSVEVWLSRMPDKGAKVLSHWNLTLAKYSQADCTFATDEMHGDPSDIQFDRHPGMIASLAAKHWHRRQPSTPTDVESATPEQRHDSQRAMQIAAKLMADVGRLKDKMLVEAGSWAAMDHAELDRRVEIMKREALAKVN